MPTVAEAATSDCSQYTICTSARDQRCQALTVAGIPSAFYYPRTLVQQPAYAGFLVAPGGVHVAEAATREVLSLPKHPYLDTNTQDRIITAVVEAVDSSGTIAN